MMEHEDVVKRNVTRVDQSPMNRLRWLLTLACGHEVWITSRSRPRRAKSACPTCVGEIDASREAIR